MTKDQFAQLERELDKLSLLTKAREIYDELGTGSALSYIKSSCRLLSKVYHPDLNPRNAEKATKLQQDLNRVHILIRQTTDEDLIALLKKGAHESQSRKKILIVEDEFGLQEMLIDILKMEGYEVQAAVDGENGYRRFMSFKPDLVITDIIMPEMDGLELAKKMRADNPRIKVIFISGFFGFKKVKRDLNTEVMQYGYPCLSKPFKISAMLEMVEEYINAPDV